jgi:two-component system cell cycle response regulator
MNYFRSKFFLRQFLAFNFITGLTFTVIAVSLFRVTDLSLHKQQLYLVESYRKEVADTIKQWTSGREASLKVQAGYLELLGEERLGSADVTALLRKQLEWNQYFYDIVIFDEHGGHINSRFGTDPGFSVTDRPYFIGAMNGRPVITGFFKSRRDPVPVMAISEPLRFRGEVRYVLVGLVKLEKYREMVAGLNLGRLGHAYLVDGNGGPLTDSRFIRNFIDGGELGQRYRLNSFSVQQVTQERAGTGHYRDFMDDQVFGSYEWLDPIQAGLIVEFKDSEVMRPVRDLAGIIAALAALVIFVGAVLAFFFTRRLIRPVNQIVAAIDQIAVQDYRSALDIKTGDELDTLVNRFNEMRDVIRQREDELRRHNEELNERAMRDGLTGLFNHVLIMDLPVRECAVLSRRREALSFIMLDIDHFKKINDTYGHLAGDAVIKGLAEIIARTVRGGDLVGRYGGEEFAVILPRASAEEAFALCERLRQNVAEAVFSGPGQPLRITISLGVCTRQPEDECGPTELIRMADSALYQAKRNGRNRVEIWTRPDGGVVS